MQLSMFTSLPSSLLLSSLILAAAARPVESASVELRELTASNFSGAIERGVSFIKYYSPWCIHCKKFAPIWEQLVAHVESQDNPGINLAHINCVTQADLCNDNNIKAYPTLTLYEDGKEVGIFEDDRKFETLVEYVTSHARRTEPPPPSSMPNPDGVVVPLDPSTFKDAIARGPTFVKFFAPWCGHCKKLAPTWVRFAAQMKDKVAVAEVNCEAHSALCSQEKVQGYPMIFFYQHGRTLDYTGRRTLAAMEAFADTALAPPLKSISASQLTPILEEHDVLYLLIHEGLESALEDRIEEASQPLHGSPQILSIRSSPDLLSSLSLQATQQLPLLVSLKDHILTPIRQLVLAPDASVQYMSDWLIANALPTSTELDSENFQRIMGPSPSPRGAPSRLIVLAAIDAQNKQHVGLVRDAGKLWHRGAHATDPRQVVFAWMDKEKWAKWLKSVYGVKPSPEPVVVVVDHGRLLYYDVSPTGAPIRLDASNIFSALEGVSSGAIRAKHSENIAERFARRLNEWMIGIQSAVSHHPVRSVLLVAVSLVGVFVGMKRFLEEDARKSVAHVHHKPGARLD